MGRRQQWVYHIEPEEFPTDFPDRLDAFRQAAGLSWRGLARRLKVNPVPCGAGRPGPLPAPAIWFPCSAWPPEWGCCTCCYRRWWRSTTSALRAVDTDPLAYWATSNQSTLQFIEACPMRERTVGDGASKAAPSEGRPNCSRDLPLSLRLKSQPNCTTKPVPPAVPKGPNTPLQRMGWSGKDGSDEKPNGNRRIWAGDCSFGFTLGLS